MIGLGVGLVQIAIGGLILRSWLNTNINSWDLETRTWENVQ